MFIRKKSKTDILTHLKFEITKTKSQDFSTIFNYFFNFCEKCLFLICFLTFELFFTDLRNFKGIFRVFILF